MMILLMNEIIFMVEYSLSFYQQPIFNYLNLN